jgi:1-acyl-sn-glycerol-3-phosphate acyltransferase
MDVLKSIVIWLIGIVCLLVFFPVTLFAWLLTLPFDRNRVVVHWLLVLQSCVISYLVPIWRIRIRGRKKGKPGSTYVIICNHQSILDILIINCIRYRYKWISKAELAGVPILGWYLTMADYLTVDRSDRDSKDKLLLDAYQFLKKGISIMIFPEGTRSADNEISYFKRGAFQLAISCQLPILPVVLDGTGNILPKHGHIFRGFHTIDLKILDPVGPESFGTGDANELAEKFRIMYEKELAALREERGAK